ncbi:MAG: HIT family protein [Candidatus Heimdallarchaeaceae archaeon]|jgi:histidine triad (HIT) family protein
MEEDCLFCKIVKGEIPSYTLYEDEEIKVFLDIYPVSKGHCLLIPKEHFSTIYDIPEAKMNFLAKLPSIARKLKEVTQATGVNILQSNEKDAGQEIFHTHFHLIPRYHNDKLMKFPPQSELNKDVAEELVEKFKI